MAKKKQDGFSCLEDRCIGVLKRVAMGEYKDGGACGDGSQMEYYECPKCNSLFSRMDYGSWEEFNYAREQKNIYPCKKIPDSAQRMP